MRRMFERFGRLDTSLNNWLVTHSIALLRISLGLIFLVFGALKLFPGVSPAEGLVTETATALTFGLVSSPVGLAITALLECAIGLCFVTGRFLRAAVTPGDLARRSSRAARAGDLWTAQTGTSLRN